MSEYGVLGQERLRLLLMRVAHLSREQRLFVAQWANRVLADAGILENVLAGFIDITDVQDGELFYRATTEGRAALAEADQGRDIDASQN